jgi:hypothetical protein
MPRLAEQGVGHPPNIKPRLAEQGAGHPPNIKQPHTLRNNKRAKKATPPILFVFVYNLLFAYFCQRISNPHLSHYDRNTHNTHLLGHRQPDKPCNQRFCVG